MVKKVGIYQLESKLGEGNYGTVYLGYNSKTLERVAAKSVQIRTLSGKSLQQMECEIKVLKNLTNSHVVQLHEVLKTQNNVYLIMEYCAGGDLATYVKTHGPVDEITAKKWLGQLVSAFQSMQEHQVMHRDLKLANILLTESSPRGDVKVADFGFARYLNDNSLALTQLGTPLYMAPEIFNGEQYSYKADVWSLGVLSFEVLVGRAAFVCRALNQLKELQQKPPDFPPVPELSEEAQDFVRVMMTYDPAERPSFQDMSGHAFLRSEEPLELPRSPEIEMDLPDEEEAGQASEEIEPDEGFEETGDFLSHSLASQVVKVEEVLQFHESLVRAGQREAAFCVVAYAQRMFARFFQQAEQISCESSQGQPLNDLYERIQLNCMTANDAYERLAARVEALETCCADKLAEVCEERTRQASPQDTKFTLELLVALLEVSPEHPRGLELFEQVSSGFKRKTQQ